MNKITSNSLRGTSVQKISKANVYLEVYVQVYYSLSTSTDPENTGILENSCLI